MISEWEKQNSKIKKYHYHLLSFLYIVVKKIKKSLAYDVNDEASKADVPCCLRGGLKNFVQATKNK